MANTKHIILGVDTSAILNATKEVDKLDGRKVRIQFETSGADVLEKAASNFETLLGKQLDLTVRINVDNKALDEFEQRLSRLKSQDLNFRFDGSPTSRVRPSSQTTDERRVNRALSQFRESYSAADLFAALQGQEARAAERLRVAQRIVEKRNLSPNVAQSFLDKAKGEPLPALFDPRRLGNRDVIHSLGHATIAGGLPAAALGALLATTPLRAAGVALGANVASVGAELLEGPKRIFESIKEKFQETALVFESTVVGISASLQAATNSFDQFGHSIGSVPNQLQASEFRARQLQSVARPALSRLGVSGGAEGTVVQSLVSGFAQRGILLDSDQFKTVASRLVGTAVAKNPDFFNNESQAARDLSDIALGSRNAGSTQLGISLGRDVLSRLNSATSADDLLKATRVLDPFVQAATESNNPAVLKRRIDQGFGNLENTGGAELLKAQQAGMQEFAKALGKEETVAAVQKLGSAIGTISDISLRSTAALVDFGAASVEFIDANKKMAGEILESSGTIGKAVSTILKPFFELIEKEAEFNKTEENVNRIRLAGVSQELKPEVYLGSMFEKIGLKEESTAFDINRAHSPDRRLAELNQLVGQFSSGSEEEKALLASKRSFIETERLSASRAIFESQSKAFDRGTVGGQIASNALQQNSLQEQLGFIRNKSAADLDLLNQAASRLSEGQGGQSELQRRLARAEAEVRVRRQAVQQASPDEWLEAQTQFGEAANKRNAIKTQIEESQTSLKQSQQALIQQASELLQSRREAGTIEQQILESTRQRLGLEQQRTETLKSGHDSRSLIGSKANLEIERIGARKEEQAAEDALRQSRRLISGDKGEISSLQKQIASDTNAELKSIHEKQLAETQQRLSTRESGIKEDEARASASFRKRLDLQLTTRENDLGIPSLERQKLGIDKGTLIGSSQLVAVDQQINLKRQQAIVQELVLLEKNIKLLSTGTQTADDKRQVGVLREQKDYLQSALIGSRTEGVGLERLSALRGLDKRESDLGLRQAAEQMAESERRAKADLDNLSISFRESKMSLSEFRAGLDEANAGQEEKLLSAAKAFADAGGDQSKIPGFLRSAMGNEEEYKQKFAGARLRRTLRESTGFDDPTLSVGPSLGLPSFGSPFADSQKLQERKLENAVLIGSNSEDVFLRDLQNKRERFDISDKRTRLQIGEGLKVKPTQEPDLQQQIQALERRLDQMNLTRTDIQPDGTLGTKAGKVFDASKGANAGGEKAQTVQVNVTIEPSDMDKMGAKIAGAISNVLMSGTGTGL